MAARTGKCPCPVGLATPLERRKPPRTSRKHTYSIGVTEAELLRDRSRGLAHTQGRQTAERLSDYLVPWFTSGRSLWARSASINRASHLDKWIAPGIGGARLRDLSAARVAEFRDWMLAVGASPSTVANVLRTLSAPLGDAAREGLIPANPVPGIKRPKVIRSRRPALSPEQAEAVRAELPTIRDRVLWGLLCAAGLRTEEALALRWADLRETPDGWSLAIDRTYTKGEIRNKTKTGHGRDVPVIARLADDLAALRELSALEADALIIANRSGRPVHLDNWRNRVFNPAAERAGVPWATPYTGRHTYTSLQIHAGLSVVQVAALGGHSAEVCLKHYAREFDRARTAPGLPLADVADARPGDPRAKRCAHGAPTGPAQRPERRCSRSRNP